MDLGLKDKVVAITGGTSGMPEGSVPVHDIVSYCVGKTANGGPIVLLAISGDGVTDAGERCGTFLLVCDETSRADLDDFGYIPPEKIIYRIDLTELQSLKVQLGDINGDGVPEIALCVYKTAKFHPVMAKRPFFFDLIDGNLIPVWLGSRLSRPFDDYILYDIDGNNTDELISVELLENGNRVVTLYSWKGFGFEVSAQSEEFIGELYFDQSGAVPASEIDAVNVIFYNGKVHIKLGFYYGDGVLSHFLR